jgi:hypothetical protein
MCLARPIQITTGARNGAITIDACKGRHILDKRPCGMALLVLLQYIRVVIPPAHPSNSMPEPGWRVGAVVLEEEEVICLGNSSNGINRILIIYRYSNISCLFISFNVGACVGAGSHDPRRGGGYLEF